MSEKEHIIRADVLAARISEMRKLVDTLEKDQKKYAAPVLAKVEGFKVPKRKLMSTKEISRKK